MEEFAASVRAAREDDGGAVIAKVPFLVRKQITSKDADNLSNVCKSLVDLYLNTCLQIMTGLFRFCKWMLLGMLQSVENFLEETFDGNRDKEEGRNPDYTEDCPASGEGDFQMTNKYQDSRTESARRLDPTTTNDTDQLLTTKSSLRKSARRLRDKDGRNDRHVSVSVKSLDPSSPTPPAAQGDGKSPRAIRFDDEEDNDVTDDDDDDYKMAEDYDESADESVSNFPALRLRAPLDLSTAQPHKRRSRLCSIKDGIKNKLREFRKPEKHPDLSPILSPVMRHVNHQIGIINDQKKGGCAGKCCGCACRRRSGDQETAEKSSTKTNSPELQRVNSKKQKISVLWSDIYPRTTHND